MHQVYSNIIFTTPCLFIICIIFYLCHWFGRLFDGWIVLMLNILQFCKIIISINESLWFI